MWRLESDSNQNKGIDSTNGPPRPTLAGMFSVYLVFENYKGIMDSFSTDFLQPSHLAGVSFSSQYTSNKFINVPTRNCTFSLPTTPMQTVCLFIAIDAKQLEQDWCQ